MSLWLFIPAFASLLTGAFVFIVCQPLRRFHKFMGFTFIFEGLVSLLNVALVTGSGICYFPLYLLYLGMLLAIPVFYYFAVQSLLRDKCFRGGNIWIFLVPLVFMATYIPVASCLQSADRDAFFRILWGLAVSPTEGTDVLLALDKTAYALYLAGYLFIQIYCIVNLPKYVSSLQNFYSDVEEKTYFPIITLLTLMGLRLVILAVFGFLYWETVPEWMPAVQAIVSVLFYGMAARCILKVKYTSEELVRMTESQAKKMAPPVAGDIIGARLQKLVDDKFFLDRDVNLIDVASMIGVNSKYVSEYLRYQYGETFMTYVNRLRVECSTEFLKNGSRSMEEIADMSGYANVSTFYRNFTKVKGMSPSKYRETSQ